MFWKHSVSETKSLLVATLFMFSAFSFIVGQSWYSMVASEFTFSANTVGVYAGVQENEINTTVAQLNERERLLAEREKAIGNNAIIQDEMTLLLVTISGLGLLGLILLNFYLDNRRRNYLAVRV